MFFVVLLQLCEQHGIAGCRILDICREVGYGFVKIRLPTRLQQFTNLCKGIVG